MFPHYIATLVLQHDLTLFGAKPMTRFALNAYQIEQLENLHKHPCHFT